MGLALSCDCLSAASVQQLATRGFRICPRANGLIQISNQDQVRRMRVVGCVVRHTFALLLARQRSCVVLVMPVSLSFLVTLGKV
ncbi:hypothetical protein J1614_003815 [Plenodomus biglobosus]|nr:hypothetical protein J1614_003815 [Plenodomus biglobosus]